MATRALTITLSDETSDLVRARVASGEYETELDMVEDGVLALVEAGDPFAGPAFDRWVRDELRPAVDEYRANPTPGVPLEVVRAELAERHARRIAQG